MIVSGKTRLGLKASICINALAISRVQDFNQPQKSTRYPFEPSKNPVQILRGDFQLSRSPGRNFCTKSLSIFQPLLLSPTFLSLLFFAQWLYRSTPKLAARPPLRKRIPARSSSPMLSAPQQPQGGGEDDMHLKSAITSMPSFLRSRCHGPEVDDLLL